MRHRAALTVMAWLAAGVAWSHVVTRDAADGTVLLTPAADVEEAYEPLTLRGIAPEPPEDEEECIAFDGAVECTPVFEQSVAPLECVENPPPDPVETGVCTLVVTVRDENGAVPEDAIDLELWRLGAPANEHWQAGDQLQARASTEQGRVQWTGLPAGRYRLFTEDARKETDDPPAFVVDGAVTAFEATWAFPRRVPVLLRVIDENGNDLQEASLRVLGVYSSGHDAEPGWKRERDLHHGIASRRSFGGCGCGGGSGAARLVEAGEGGFLLSRGSESSRGRSWSSSVELTFPGRTSVKVFRHSDHVRPPLPTTYVARSVPLDRIFSSVRTQDGRPVRETGARITAVTRAERVEPGAPLPELRYTFIDVRIELEGHDTLTFETWGEPQQMERTVSRSTSE